MLMLPNDQKVVVRWEESEGLLMIRSTSIIKSRKNLKVFNRLGTIIEYSIVLLYRSLVEI